MKQQILKYPLTPSDVQTIQMPYGAKILSVAPQGQTAMIWALVIIDEALTTQDRTIEIFGTGQEIDCTGSPEREFIGTFQIGSFVGHVFERIN